MNLLVCRTRLEAERAIDLLGLDKSWAACGAADALAGGRFDKIVVITGRWVAEESAVDWLTEVLPLKLPPGGKVLYL